MEQRRCSVFKHETVFIQKLIDSNMILVQQPLNEGGLLLSCVEFLNEFELPVTPK